MTVVGLGYYIHLLHTLSGGGVLALGKERSGRQTIGLRPRK